MTLRGRNLGNPYALPFTAGVVYGQLPGGEPLQVVINKTSLRKRTNSTLVLTLLNTSAWAPAGTQVYISGISHSPALPLAPHLLPGKFSVSSPASGGKHPGGMAVPAHKPGVAPRGKPASRRGLTFKSQVRRPGIGFHPGLLAAAAHGAAHGAAVVAPIHRKKGSARAIGGDESCGPGIG